ncbi:MAG: WHG domain-containing protein [Pseudomonadota bacterium]
MRNVLIETGLQVLAEDGLEKLTLRRVAARAGVSHAAPAYHFKGLPELLGFMCAIGFERLIKAMEDAQHHAPETPRDSLVAICEGYVSFAIANRGLIQLMFSNRRGLVDDAPLKPSAERAYSILREACAPFEPVGSDPESTETMVWSLVHGFAFLRIGKRFVNPYRSSIEPEISDVLPQLTLKPSN